MINKRIYPLPKKYPFGKVSVSPCNYSNLLSGKSGKYNSKPESRYASVLALATVYYTDTPNFVLQSVIFWFSALGLLSVLDI